MYVYGQASGGAEQREKKDYPAFIGDVLVCEDDSLSRELIRAQLKMVGLEPVLASNGMVGVEIVKNHMSRGRPFDLILMDINMPVMDGLTATMELVEMGSTTPIVAYSSNFIASNDICISLGLSDYLEKPCSMKKLCDCLSKYLMTTAVPK